MPDTTLEIGDKIETVYGRMEITDIEPSGDGTGVIHTRVIAATDDETQPPPVAELSRGTPKTTLVECDKCGEEAVPADIRPNSRPVTRGHTCNNCGRRY